MYTITRNQAAEILGISTRSVDRYIRSGKLRSQKKWKIVYIHQKDIENLTGQGKQTQEIVSPHHINTTTMSTTPDTSFTQKLYSEIEEKNTQIQFLSKKLWQMEEIVKNSISMVEFKKSQFLLQESNTSLNNELSSLKKDLQEKNQAFLQEKKTNIILYILIALLVIITCVIWFIKI